MYVKVIIAGIARARRNGCSAVAAPLSTLTPASQDATGHVCRDRSPALQNRRRGKPTMFFIVFKGPRTGSSSLSELLNSAQGVACITEILNRWDRSRPVQEYLDGFLRVRIPPDTRVAGFTINPIKSGLTRLEFDPSLYIQLFGPLRLYFMYRRDVMSKAVSIWVS